MIKNWIRRIGCCGVVIGISVAVTVEMSDVILATSDLGGGKNMSFQDWIVSICLGTVLGILIIKSSTDWSDNDGN